MIKKLEPLGLAEVKELLKPLPESEKVKKVSEYIKKFSDTSSSEALKLKKELRESLPSIDNIQITKIIDFMPEDKEDIRKIFTEAGIEESEISKILEIVKKYL